MSDEPKPPPERIETARRRVLDALRRGPVTAKDISAMAGIPEREVAFQLEHVDKSLKAAGERLLIGPARCLDCAFAFAKRERFKRPGKCPVCKGGRIEPPVFSVARSG